MQPADPAAVADAMDSRGEHEMLVRGWAAGDERWITNSWINNGRKMPVCKRVGNNVYSNAWHRVMEHLLPRARVLVACHPRATNVNFGWICGEVVQAGPEKLLVVHYCYVKREFKAERRSPLIPGEFDANGEPKKGPSRYEPRFGIGRMLLGELCRGEEDVDRVVYTCHTPQGHGWLQHLYHDGTLPGKEKPEYDPFLLFTTLPLGWY